MATRKRKNPVFTWSDGTEATHQQLSDLLGVNTRSIRRYVAHEDCPSTLVEFIAWRVLKGTGIDLNQDLTNDEIPKDMTVQKLDTIKKYHDTRKSKAEANRSELGEQREQYEFDIEKGEYISRETIEVNLANVSRALSDLLFAFPERILTRVMGSDDQREILDVMNHELREITSEIDNWEIIPE